MIWLLRHGDAEDGAGKPDAERELTEKGERQSRDAGKALKALGVELDVCLTSPKVRAKRHRRAGLRIARLPGRGGRTARGRGLRPARGVSGPRRGDAGRPRAGLLERRRARHRLPREIQEGRCRGPRRPHPSRAAASEGPSGNRRPPDAENTAQVVPTAVIRTLRLRLTLPAFFRSALTAWPVSLVVNRLVAPASR